MNKVFLASDKNVVNKLQQIKNISFAKHGIDGALLGNAIYLNAQLK